MKQKIRFEKNIKEGVLAILESSEVDPGVIMPLMEQDYNLDDIIEASDKGLRPFSISIRKRGFFPSTDLCIKLFESTKEFFKNESETNIVVEYDDTEAFPKEERFLLEEDDVELDQLLEEDGDTKEDEIKEIDSGDESLKFTPEDNSEHEN